MQDLIQPTRRYLRRREVARAVGVSLRTLDRWLAEEGLPHVVVGRTVLIDVEELEHWLAAHRRGGNAASA